MTKFETEDFPITSEQKALGDSILASVIADLNLTCDTCGGPINPDSGLCMVEDHSPDCDLPDVGRWDSANYWRNSGPPVEGDFEDGLPLAIEEGETRYAQLLDIARQDGPFDGWRCGNPFCSEPATHGTEKGFTYCQAHYVQQFEKGLV